MKALKKRIAPSDDEIAPLSKFSRFLFVWGKCPPLAEIQVDKEDTDEIMEGQERFWAFWKPGEIRKLTEWVRIKSGWNGETEEKDGKKYDNTKALVKGLETFANTLEWRTSPAA